MLFDQDRTYLEPHFLFLALHHSHGLLLLIPSEHRPLHIRVGLRLFGVDIVLAHLLQNGDSLIGHSFKLKLVFQVDTTSGSSI